MKTIISTLIFCLLVCISHGFFNPIVGSGNIITRSIPVSNFVSLKFEGTGELTIVHGKRCEVIVEAYENLIPLLKTEVDDGELKLKYRRNFNSGVPVKMTIVAPVYSAIKIEGRIKLMTDGPLKGEKLSLNMEGQIFGEMELAVRMLITELDGQSRLVLRGEAQKHFIKLGLSGSTNLDAVQLATLTTDIRAAGSGWIKVHIRDELDIHEVGKATIFYKGEPVISQKTAVGYGQIKRL